VFLVSLSFDPQCQDTNNNPNKKEPPILDPYCERATASNRAAAGNPDMSYHVGPIVPSVT
jgi:hypothetical protein